MKNNKFNYLLIILISIIHVNIYAQVSDFKNNTYEFNFNKNYDIELNKDDKVYLSSTKIIDSVKFETKIRLGLLSKDAKKNKINSVKDISNLEIIEILEIYDNHIEKNKIEYVTLIGEYEVYLRAVQEIEYEHLRSKIPLKATMNIVYYFLTDNNLFAVSYTNVMIANNDVFKDKHELLKLFRQETDTGDIALIFKTLKVKK